MAQPGRRYTADHDVGVGGLPTDDVDLQLLQGQNVPWSRRLRLERQTEEWLYEFIEDFVGLDCGGDADFLQWDSEYGNV
eukprot:1515195-Karenia_brevis.AAC.1